MRGADGVVNGVVAFHINASWLQRYLTETAQGLTIDLFLISPTGSVSLASNGSGNELLDRDIARIARTGANVGTREVWEDGNTYFSTLVSDVTYGEVPNFGWRMVGRIDTQLVNPIVDKLIKGGLVLMVLSSGVAIVLSALYARVYLVPIARLSAAAHRIRNGSREYPPAARSTADAHAIASSLLDLQHAKAPMPTSTNPHQGPDHNGVSWFADLFWHRPHKGRCCAAWGSNASRFCPIGPLIRSRVPWHHHATSRPSMQRLTPTPARPAVPVANR